MKNIAEIDLKIITDGILNSFLTYRNLGPRQSEIPVCLYCESEIEDSGYSETYHEKDCPVLICISL